MGDGGYITEEVGVQLLLYIETESRADLAYTTTKIPVFNDIFFSDPCTRAC